MEEKDKAAYQMDYVDIEMDNETNVDEMEPHE